MVGLPPIGARVRLWPVPGRSVQLGTRPLDSGGRWMSPAGEEVIFDHCHVEQIRAGEVMLHAPPCDRHQFDGGRCLKCGCDEGAEHKAPKLKPVK